MRGTEAMVNVLIVGASTTGLMTAALLARYGISFHVIDKRESRIRTSRSHNINSRSMEVLHSMGIYQTLENKGVKVREYTYWSPYESGHIRRTNYGPDTINETPFPWTLSVDEGELGDILVDDLGARGCKIEHSMELLNYQKDDPNQSLIAFVKNHKTNVIEAWHCGYILGCDGTRSKVREAAGVRVESYGEMDFWGMGKFTAESDFPDVRRRSTIRSEHGNFVLTPGKDGSVRVLTRIEAERTSQSERGRPANSQIPDLRQIASAKGLVQATQKRISNSLVPYSFKITQVHWIDDFGLQKKLAKRFSDDTHRVFLLGDACHVHSPITKQMINGGLLDALNLTWKLALVLDGFAPRSLLVSYETERRAMLPKALQLDAQFDLIFAAQPGDPSLSTAGFYSFEEASGYTSGCGLRYPQSKIVREEVRTLIKKVPDALTPGKRLLPLKLIRNIDGNEVSSLEVMPPNCRFTILVFTGNCLPAAIFQGLANFLASAESPLTCFNSAIDPRQSRVDLILVHTLPHFDVSIADLPQPFPQYPENIFEDLGGKAHQSIGLIRELGALCCIRPDGYVGIVTNLDDGRGVKEYLRSALDSILGNINDREMALT